jgi:hypothetical protein
MNSIEFSQSVETALDIVKSRLVVKNQEYAHNSDVFRNFSTGISLQNTPEGVAWEYMTKHLQWLKDTIKEQKTPNAEQVDEKIIDIVNYLLIIRAMYEDKNYNNLR